MKATTIAGKTVPIEALPLLEPERRTLTERLRRRDIESIRIALVDAYERLDQKINDAIETSGLVPACHRGCGWCCHGVKVNVSAPEAILIAEHLSSGNDDLRIAVQAAAERRRNMNTDEYFISGDACPFLGASNECSIYAVRPMACRRHCCLDSSECERAVKNPRLKLAVSQHAPANAAGVIAALALSAAVQDARLDARTFELATAVSLALRDGAARRWAAGERVFDGAVRPVDAEDQAIAKADLSKYSVNPESSAKIPWKSHSKKNRRRA
jgi:Fe-S-cluster containining protein